MKCLVHEGESYIVTRNDAELRAVRPVDPDRVSIFIKKECGEITLVTRRAPWLYRELKQIRKGEQHA